MKLRRLALLTALSACALSAIASTASAAPVWNLEMHHNQTHFPPGGTGQYWFDLNNVGSSASAGPVELEVQLPTGLTRDKVIVGEEFITGVVLSWSCPGSPGDTTVTCTSTSGSVPRHRIAHLILEVDVSPSAAGELIASAKLQGGGAEAAATDAEPTPIDPTPASFGVVESSFVPDFFAADGVTVQRRAGAHPALLTVPVDFNSVPAPSKTAPALTRAADSVRNVTAELPPGFIGNPTAVGECTQAEYTVGKCPPSSQVGRFDGILYSPGAGFYFPFSTGLFNMVHPRGSVTDLAFQLNGNPVHIKASLNPANRYAITTTLSDINESLPAFSGKPTVWGVPADPSHDSERCPRFTTTIVGNTTEACATDHESRPFISMPSQCEDDNTFRFHHYDSWQDTGVFGPEITYTIPGLMTDCEKPRFEPEVEIEPTGRQANTPTGLDVHVKVAQNENPNALATPPVKRIEVTLPEGMSFSPSFADGLQSCTLAQMRLGTNEPIACPDASRIGEVELHTPLLPKSAEGSMYLAAQRDNPFNSTFALLLVLEDTEERGALIKVPGRIDVDPVTGQIVTVFEDTPQFPFDDLTLKFRSGPRAPLVSPPTCGTHTIAVQVVSYAQPQDPVDASNAYEVTEGPNGTPCPPDAPGRPFAPKFSAGTLNPLAGAYSPFLFRLSREDHEQELSSVKATLPPGLLAKIAGMTLCPEQAIASISEAEGTGRSERDNPACPDSSLFGTVSAGLGAGPGPNYFPGKVYLAGPYKGAPLSLAVVAPALAGPYDLGSVVVRTALRVDPNTAQATAVSDLFPTILHGVLLRVRDVRLRADRPETTINPTSCARMSVDGQIAGTGGALFGAASPFQVGSCASLAFEPKLAFRLFGGTKRGAHPKFRAVVRFPAGGANTASASVALPRSEFLDQGHIKTICTRVQFAANECPQGSIYGTVKAKTPLLDEVLSGPIYLRSSDNLLPDLVAAFRGGRVDFNLTGRIDSKDGGIRNTFDFVPDAPVSWAVFTFQGGDKGLLQNSRDICKNTFRATAKFRAQNGDRLTLRPEMKAKCGKSQQRRAERSSHRPR